MPKESIRIIYHKGPPKYLHALMLPESEKPFRSTYLGRRVIELLDEKGSRYKEFPFDDSPAHMVQSYNIILEEAHQLNKERRGKIIDETGSTRKDITSKL
ncbi:MAG: hypothetical protein Q7R87_02630 [Nanoarchaeota archaeon]|nr:hypothetical protein [Nanoarchaeota archaeon]